MLGVPMDSSPTMGATETPSTNREGSPEALVAAASIRSPLPSCSWLSSPTLGQLRNLRDPMVDWQVKPLDLQKAPTRQRTSQH